MTQVFASPVPGEPWPGPEDDEITDRVQASSAEGEHGLGSGAHVSPVTSEGVSPPFATPEPGVAWTSGEVDAMTAYIQARNAALDPLLAEAVLLLRSSQWPGGAAGWPNEGTAGDVADAVVQNSPTLVDGLVRCVAADTDRMVIPAAADLNPGVGSGTWAFQLSLGDAPTEGEVGLYLRAASGAFGVDQNGVDLACGVSGGFGLNGFYATVSDGNPANTALLITDSGVVADTMYLVVLRIDHTADADLWVDGTKEADADISTLGAITDGSTTDLVQGGENGGHADASADWRTVAYWDRALTDTEITVDLPAALGL